MRQSNTSSDILSIAREILARDGAANLSFDAIARDLGKSKQAILYWYPTKMDLLSALYVPWLQAEVDAVVGAMNRAQTPDAAIDAFVRAVIAFHLEDLDRFRLMYLVPQTMAVTARPRNETALLEKVHPITDQLYRSLADRLETGTARAEAAAIHAAALGQVLMFGLGDALNDPLKHGVDTMTKALTSRLRDGDQFGVRSPR